LDVWGRGKGKQGDHLARQQEKKRVGEPLEILVRFSLLCGGGGVKKTVGNAFTGGGKDKKGINFKPAQKLDYVNKLMQRKGGDCWGVSMKGGCTVHSSKRRCASRPGGDLGGG